MPRKVFVAGEILTAADVNTNLMDQAVMVFDDSAARGSAIPSPSEGMVTYLKDTDALEKYTTAWEAVNTQGILQVVEARRTDTFTESVTAFGIGTTDVISASITPTSASNKVLVIIDAFCSSYTSSGVYMNVYRNGTLTDFIGDSAGSRTRTTDGVGGEGEKLSAIFVDSPASTSSQTYSFRIGHRGSTTGNVYLNRYNDDADSAFRLRRASSIVLMEVAG